MSEIPRIITADCSEPREIDDGLFVEPLDENYELYRVGVCVVDTAKVYSHGDIKQQAFKRAEAKYYDLPGGERGYDPMIDPEAIKSLEFTAGSVRDALIVTFTVGQNRQPADVDISFGPVEVIENKSYKDFANYVSYGRGGRFGRASQLIRDHLGYIAYGDHVEHKPAWLGNSDEKRTLSHSERAWKNGSKVNEAFMVATNHLVGSVLSQEGRPAVYRVHDPEDDKYIEIMSSNMAHFSTRPGLHTGLNLDPYCRVTSPLRRLDDFVMNYQLKKRFQDKAPSAQDSKEVAFAVRRLNQELIANAPKELSRLSRQDVLGRSVVSNNVAIA